MQGVAYPLMVYRLTGSASLLGLVALSGVIPHIFMSIFGGVIADRLQKKNVLLIGLGSFTVLSFTVAMLLTLGILNSSTWPILMGATICQMSLMGLLMPARHSILRELVGTEMLMNAVSLNMLGQNLWQMMAPAAAGFLIAGFGFEFVYWLMTGIYGLGTFFIFRMQYAPVRPVHTKNPIENLKDGFKYVAVQHNILWLLMLMLAGVLFARPYTQLMPIFVDDIFKVGAQGMGMLLSFAGFGALGGSLIVASLPNRRRGQILLIGSGILGLALACFAFSSSWYLSLAFMVFVGLGLTCNAALTNTLIQTHTQEEYRGRVMGIYDMQMSFNNLAVFVGGVLTDWVGVQWALGGFGLVLVGINALALAFLRRIRDLD